MTTNFVFGAGASFGSLHCEPEVPPLGQNLFRAMKQGGFLSNIEGEWAARFEDFEEGMEYFFCNRSGEVVRFLKEMSLFFLKYKPVGGNLYTKLASAALASKERSVFMTTNYDLLLEYACDTAGGRFDYSFEKGGSHLSLLKIHGSCNFITDCYMRGFSLSFKDWDKPAFKFPVKPSRDLREIFEFCRDSAVAPSIAMYSPSKLRLFDGDFVEGQYDSWVESLKFAKKVFIVGARVHLVDKHIWGVLSQVDAEICYVGKENSGFEDWSRDNGRKADKIIGDTFESAMPYMLSYLRGMA